MKDQIKIYSIGHSNHTVDEFIHLLNLHDIKVVVDVRSSPYSKYVPHFNRENLRSSLKSQNINYQFLGHRIGGKPKDLKFYQDHTPLYDLIEKEPLYQEGIDKLIKLAQNNKTVIMCSEEEPYKCHRYHLITQTLLKGGVDVNHIRGNGRVEKSWKQKKTKQTTLF